MGRPVTPLVALLSAQTQASLNRSVRESGFVGRAASLLLWIFVAAALVPELVFGAGIGLTLGRELVGENGSQMVPVLATTHAVLAFVFGTLGGLMSDPRFGDEGFRVYPVPGRQLLAAEMLNSFQELAPLLAAATFVGMGLGLSLVLPGATPVVWVIVLQGIVWTALLQQLVGSFKRAIGKRATGSVLVVVPAAVIAFVGLLAWWRPRESWSAFVSALRFARDVLPSSFAYRGLAAFARGETSSGLALQLVLLASTALLFAAAATALVAERRLEGRVATSSRSAPDTFSFRSPVEGLGKLFLSQVWSGRDGKILVLMPAAMTAVFAALRLIIPSRPPKDDALAGLLASNPPWLTYFLLFVVLSSNELLFNEFGLDRSGVRTLLLLPIATRDLVLGKLRGQLLLVLVRGGLGVVPLFTLIRITPGGVAHALGAAGTFFAGLFVAGFLFSVRFPRKARGEGETASRIPLGLLFIPGLVTAALAALLIGVQRVSGTFAPWAFVALLGVAIGGVTVSLPALARALDRERERLCEEL